jgi:hypothetical protein
MLLLTRLQRGRVAHVVALNEISIFGGVLSELVLVGEKFGVVKARADIGADAIGTFSEAVLEARGAIFLLPGRNRDFAVAICRRHRKMFHSMVMVMVMLILVQFVRQPFALS